MTYVLSDIHGNLKAWQNILNQINLQEGDELYVLGDAVDRNSYGIEILQTIMKSPNIHMLLGNHEYMMMEALGFPYEEIDEDMFEKPSKGQSMYNWYQNGGNVTHQAWNKLNKDEQEGIKKFLKDLPLNILIEANGQNFLLVHAAAEPIYDELLEYVDQPRASFCVWDRETIHWCKDVEDCKIIFGHTPTCNLQDNDPMEIYNDGNIYGIDCGAAYGKEMGGRLCCLRLDDMKVFYSEEETK